MNTQRSITDPMKPMSNGPFPVAPPVAPPPRPERAGPAHADPHLPIANGGRPATRGERAADAEVDDSLRSLTRSTSIEELTRSGRTGNLKTLSERDLKEWIKEALRTAIASTTSLGEHQRDQLLAATRTELMAIMAARRNDDHAHADDAHELAQLTVQRDALRARLTTSESMGGERLADLQGQLTAAIARRDVLAGRVAEFEARLAAALAVAAAETSDLRDQLGERDARAITVGLTRDEAQRVAHEVMVRLIDAQALTMAETVALTERIAAADSTNAELDRRRDAAERRADHAEATVTAQSATAAASAGLAEAAAQVGATQRAGSAAQLKDAEATRARLIGELAAVRAALTAEQQHLAAAIQAARESGLAADQRARQAGETLAAAEVQLVCSTGALQAAEVDRLGAERGMHVVEDALADLARERDRLAAALRAAEAARGGADGRLRALEGERDDARRAAAAAARRATLAEKTAERLAAAPVPSAVPAEVAALQAALDRARSVITDQDGEPREDVSGSLVARKPGRWLTAWRDGKGRLKVARTVGDHWVHAGRIDGVDPVEGMASEPVLLAHGGLVCAAWRGADGHALLAALDDTGRLQRPPRDLGPAAGPPALSRGGGAAPIFVITTDHGGHVLLHETDGAAPIDLTTALEAPPAAGLAAAWHWPLEGSRHVAYRDAEGAVHEYMELKGRWFHAALSARTAAPAAAADPIGYAPADHSHVIYLGLDGHVHEIGCDGMGWHHCDLTVSAGAPAASGPPTGGYVAGRHCVVGRGVDAKAYCLRLGKDWRHASLASLGAIHGEPQIAALGSEAAIAYRDAAGARRWAKFSDGRILAGEQLPGA